MKRIVAALSLCAACGHSPHAPTSSSAPASPVAPSTDASSRVVIRGPEASPITFERMGKWPEPGWQVPTSIAFSPDGRWVTYLESENHDDEMVLFAEERRGLEHRILRASMLPGKKGQMSREEELRRERERKHD